MTSFNRWAAALSVVLLAACGGGGGDPGSPPFGGGPGAGPTVARITMVLTNAVGVPAASLPNSGTERISVTVTALDANNSVVPNAPISFSVNSGAEVAPTGTATDAGGKLVAFVGLGPDRSSRSITVTASTGTAGLSASSSFLVTGAKLTATTPPVAAPGAAISATYTLEDSSGNPMVNEKVTLSGGGAAIGEMQTNATGKAVFVLNAPAAAGAFTLTASAAGETLERVIQVQASSVPPASGVVTGASVSANPSVVGVNTSSTTNATTIRALFKGTANAPINNVRVWFTLPDPNSVGGRFSDTGIVYSDATGTASTTYVPGAVASPTDGVTVLACYSNVDFSIPGLVAGICPATASDGSAVRQATAKLTVVDQALRLSIGTDELIGLGNVTYIKDFVVVVVDAAGRAKADVEITPKIDLSAFYKGYYNFVTDKWVQFLVVGRSPIELSCLNEDVNRNGNNEGEDANSNGELDPAGVSITMLGSSKTDATGKAIVRIEYPRDRATWIDYMITVTGRVGGSEGLAVYRGLLGGLGNLPAPGEVFKNDNVAPAFVISPYGREAGCNNAN